MLIILTLISLVWLVLVAIVVGLCVMASRADAPAGEDAPVDHDQDALAQSPRRPRTWGIVRRRIFASPHKDQLVTYK